ncbi:MAG: pentapeptide repeat-containing protein, partial [Rhizonema sp. PD38]|nr:pentapeptide repeat-containing protein [Rhizonema sp. PD38]
MSKDYRGKSFKNQNLVNQDFSYADIRGTDFSNAIIKDANFTGVRAGLKLHSVMILLIGLFLLAIFSAISSIISAGIVVLLPYFLLFVNPPQNPITILN